MRAEVRLQIDTSMPEKLIQQALLQGAEFSRIRLNGSRTIIADCSESCADTLLALCKRYRLNCKVLRRRGKSVLRAKIRSRITLIPGALLCIILCSFVLSRIWIIDVAFTGPSAHLGQEKLLRNCLEEMNIRPGIKAAALDSALIQTQLLARAESCSHIGVRLQGVRLLIEAAPEVPSPEVHDLASPRDLVSAMDGVVKSVNVKSGEACVQPGDTVRRGQLLIRGEEDKSKEETTAVGALGEVHIRSWFEGSAEGDIKEDLVRRTGRSSQSSVIRLMGWSFPLSSGEALAQYETETRILPVVGLFLPLEIIRETRYETQTVTAEADREALENRLRSLAQAEARSKLSASGPETYEITDYWEESTTDDNLLRLRAVYEIAADVAVTRDALIP